MGKGSGAGRGGSGSTNKSKHFFSNFTGSPTQLHVYVHVEWQQALHIARPTNITYHVLPTIRLRFARRGRQRTPPLYIRIKSKNDAHQANQLVVVVVRDSFNGLVVVVSTTTASTRSKRIQIMLIFCKCKRRGSVRETRAKAGEAEPDAKNTY